MWGTTGPRPACGHPPFDDEGTPTQDTPLIKEGVLVAGCIPRDRATLGERPTGNARAISFRHPHRAHDQYLHRPGPGGSSKI